MNSLVILLLFILGCSSAAMLGFLFGAIGSRESTLEEGRKEMAALVEARYGPLLEQLEQLAEQTDALAVHLSGEARQQINERIEAMREASRFN